jgi:WD40 repeat protein
VTTLAFHPEGRFLATGCLDHLGRLFAVPGDATGSRWPPFPHRQEAGSAWFQTFASPPLFVDGGRGLITYGGTGGLTWRDVETGAEVRTLDSPQVSGQIASITLSPEGRHLAVSGFQSTRVKEAVAAAFTPDGRWVLSASVDGTARVWDWRNGRPITPPLTIEGEPLSLAVTPDGKYAVVGGSLSALAVLDLAELARIDVDPDTLCLQAELLAGQRVHEGGGTVNLSADEWLDRWRAYHRSTSHSSSLNAIRTSLEFFSTTVATNVAWLSSTRRENDFHDARLGSRPGDLPDGR